MKKKIQKLYFESYGSLTLKECAEKILRDSTFTQALIDTINATIKAKNNMFHVQAVGRLHDKCVGLREMLSNEQFLLKDDLEASFDELAMHIESDQFQSLKH